MAMMEYEAFQVEAGLYGDIFNSSWKNVGVLATEASWFENLWRRSDFYGVKLQMKEEMKQKCKETKVRTSK